MDVIPKFESLLSEFSEVREKARVIARTKAPEFNVFDLLGVTRDEVRTHSAMLGELLNPRGSHGQETLFLDSFIAHCLEKDPKIPAFQKLLAHSDRVKCSVLTEMHTSFGRLDIVILNAATGFLCVIENKVDAFEQNHQLERYFQWLETMQQEFPFQVMVFLTTRGSAAATAGTHYYLPLSYHIDIINWLENTIPLIEAFIVKGVVEQYCEISRRL